VEVQRKLSGAVVGLQGRLRCSALGQEGVRPREDVGLCRVGLAESLPVATMHRFEDLRRWRAKLDLVFGHAYSASGG
jgi:hypothetical protein